MGTIATLIGVFGVVIPEYAPSFLEGVLDSIGTWGYWILIAGTLLLIGGIWQTWSTHSKQKEFEELIDVDSQIKFQRNQDDLEYLAWDLGGEYRTRVKDKKKQFKIK